MSRITFFALAGSCLLATGCQSMPSPIETKIPWLDQEEEALAPPERIITVWTDTIYQQPGRPPTRGFGGRVYFYGRQGDVVPVTGKLTIYAYDDTGMELSADRPTRKYVFTEEQLARYRSESEIGASYNIWIPWDPVGGEEKHINLFPVFHDESGKIVRGAFTESRLPGRRVITEEERRGFYVSRRKRFTTDANRANSDQQTAGGANAAAENRPPQSTLKTTTIRVPQSMAARLRQNAERGMALVQPQPTTPLGQPLNQPQPTTPIPAGGPMRPGYPGNGQHGAQGDVQPATYHAPGQPPALGQSGYHGARQENTVSATARPWARQDPRSVRFEQPRFRVPALPGVQRDHEHGQIRQSPLTPQFGHPSQP
jgi:hypothetical protein